MSTEKNSQLIHFGKAFAEQIMSMHTEQARVENIVKFQIKLRCSSFFSYR